jgi:hypothetical protein
MSSQFDGLGTAGLSMLSGFIGADNQHRRQKELMGIQYHNQRLLNQQGHDLQHEMWKKTSYPAQLEMMKKAGLSPGLMYGGGAGSGGSTGSQGGGSAAGGSAAGFSPMDMSQIMMMDANRDLLEAKAEEARANAADKRGQTPESKERINAIQQDIAESVAREKNLSAEEKLKVEQKLKTIQETTNLKTIDEWNKVKKGLDELKKDKKVTGSAIVDLMTQVGLDPVNNDEDKYAVRTLLGLFYGSSVAKNIMQGIGGLKGNPGANIINLGKDNFKQ